MLHLSDDILVFMLDIYTSNYIKCKKNTKRINKLYMCRKFKVLYKTFIIPKFKCELYYVSKINYNICCFHNNITIEDVKKIVNQIKRVENKTYPKVYHNNNSYDDTQQIVSIGDNFCFIHCSNLIKNEEVIRLLLNKFGYEMLNYCCNGTGCRIKKNNTSDSNNNTSDSNNIYENNVINLIHDTVIN